MPECHGIQAGPSARGSLQFPQLQGNTPQGLHKTARLPLLGGLVAVLAPALHVCSVFTAAGVREVPLAVQKEKRRTPAWTDRVLFRGGARPVQQLTYTSANLLVSDHKPVCSNLRLQVGQWRCSLTTPATELSVCTAPAALHLVLKWALCKSLRSIFDSA